MVEDKMIDCTAARTMASVSYGPLPLHPPLTLILLQSMMPQCAAVLFHGPQLVSTTSRREAKAVH